jgi:serine/threonine protein kinase
MLPSSGKDLLLDRSVAIKKIVKPMKTFEIAKRTWRELRLLKNFRHENVCQLIFHIMSSAYTSRLYTYLTYSSRLQKICNTAFVPKEYPSA